MIRSLLVVILITASILFFWRNIIFNFNSHLPGWMDELFIIWIFQNNIHHLNALDFSNLYETNAIYPFKYTLSFAEHMYFPSLLIFITSFFTKNIIAQFNILLVLNHIFIFLASLLFFKKLFKNGSAALITSFYITFSPYFFTKISHFQMIFFWPLLLSLYFLVDYFEKSKKRSLILSGILSGIQFLSSVYLGIMNLTIILIWFITKTLFVKRGRKDLITNYFIFMSFFIITSIISLYGYFLVNQEYQSKRDYGEYVTYSAHLTDYIFPNRGHYSYLYKTPLFGKIQSLNHHQIGEFAVFAGLLPLIFAVYLLIPRIKTIKKEVNINFNFSFLIVFSLLLIFIGFILSLGPRLFVNGQYTELPLPSDLLLKIFPPIGIIRAVARWHFLVILGFSILLGLGYIKLEKKLGESFGFKKTALFLAASLWVFIEFYPLKPVSAVTQTWNDSSYKFLAEKICKNPTTTLLEYPFHYRNLDADIGKDVNYMAKILLNSTQINCKILSGYYGYEPPKYMEIRNEFADGFDEKDVNIVKSLGINYIKLNKYAISEKEFEDLGQSKILENFKKIYDQNEILILENKPVID